MLGILISIILLISCFFGDHSYGFYQILKIAISVTGIYLLLKLYKVQKFNWMWIFGTIILIFNPFIPLNLGKGNEAKDLWLIVDSITLILFLIILPVIQPKLKKVYKIIGICIGILFIIVLLGYFATEIYKSNREKYFTQYDPLKIGEYNEFKNNKIEYSQFIEKLRNKYTEYTNLNDDTMVRKIIYKYPQYKSYEYDANIAYYSKALKTNSKDANSYLNRGITYFQNGLNDDAIEDFKEVIRLNPKNADAYYNRGISYHKKGLGDDAIEDYTKAIQLNQKFALAYHFRGLAYYMKGLNDLCIPDWKKSADLGNELSSQNLKKFYNIDY